MENMIFEIKEVDSKTGIYITINNIERLVYPYELFNALWDCYEKRYICGTVEAKFQILTTEVWGYYFDTNKGYLEICYNRGEFINSAIQSLRDLCDFILNDKEVAYNNIRISHAESLLDGLNNLVIPRNYSQVFQNEIKVEEFYFDFIEGYSSDIGFELKIGSRSYRSYLTDWDNDFNVIRYELEGFIIPFYNINSLNINCDTSVNKITVEKKLIHGDSKSKGIVKVTFFPDLYVGGPIICGWCNIHQILRSIYIAFLRLFTTECNSFDIEVPEHSWNKFRVASYNKIQSCIIENYLLGVQEDEWGYSNRQRIVNNIEEMIADFKALEQKLLFI